MDPLEKNPQDNGGEQNGKGAEAAGAENGNEGVNAGNGEPAQETANEIIVGTPLQQ